MDAAKLAVKIYKGYEKAARRIGYMTTIKRNGFVVGETHASFNAEDMSYSKPDKYGNATWWCLIDGTLTRVGDYLYNEHDGWFFIAAMQQALPILVVSCNRVLTIKRPMQQTGIGVVGYNADYVATEVILAEDYHASVLAAGAGKDNRTLPSDTSYAQFTILMPNVGVRIRTSDIFVDELANRFIAMNVELTDLGYRIIAMQAVA